MGAGLGAVVGEEIPSLEDALRDALLARGLEFVSVRSTSAQSVAILFREGERYRAIDIAAPEGAANIDDALYDVAIAELTRMERANAEHP